MFGQRVLPLTLVALYASLSSSSPLSARQSLATVYSSCSVPKTAALTFDDGPYIYLQQISDLLTAHGAKGTFFFNGNNFDCIYNPDAITRVKYAYNAGHQVGSHTWSHGDLTTFSSDQINDGMFRVEEAFSRIIGVRPAFMRPPYGSYNTLVQQVTASRGQVLALWDWDTGDADGNTTAQSEAVYQDAVNAKASNMLFLEHETEQTTATTLIPFAINLLQGAGYKLVTMAECLGLQPYQAIGTPQTQTAAWTCNGTPDPGAACSGTACETGIPPLNGVGTTPPPPPPTSGGFPTTALTNQNIHPSASASKCLTIASQANNAAVGISDCVAGSAAQSWALSTSGTISAFGGTLCLDLTNGVSTNGNKMQVYACSAGNTNQRWETQGTTNGAIEWAGGASCLDNSGGVLTNGNPTQIWSCTAGPNQAWVISAAGGSTTPPPNNPPPTSGTHVIHPGASSTTCLSAPTNANGAAVVVQPCSAGAASQQWTAPASGASGTLSIYGTKCLDVTGGSTTNGVKMQIWDCAAGNTNQLMAVTTTARIQWSGKGECLDLTGGSLASGNQVQMWACATGNTNQVWNIV